MALMTGGDDGDELPGRRVLINPHEMKPNPAIPEEVWQKLLSLPSQTLPKRQARPVKRMTALAHELAADNLLKDAGKLAHNEMHKVLDGARVRYAEEIRTARGAILTVEGKTVRTDVETKNMSFDDFVEVADYAVIEDAYTRAGRIVSPDLATTYSEHLASKSDDDTEDEEALIEAHTVVAAMGLVSSIKEHLEAEAEKLSNEWLGKYRVPVKSLSDERQEVYRQIRKMSSDPLDVDLARPNIWLQPTTAKEADGTEVALPLYERHMLCDDNGLFPEAFNSWEDKVLLTEMQRDDSVAWYRNPARASQDSLGVTYEEGEEIKIVRPDFIFFSQLPDGSIVADIIDPHAHYLADALPKLKGLSRYAETNPEHFRRIEAINETESGYKVLDLSEPAVRAAIYEATNAKILYDGPFAAAYTDTDGRPKKTG